MPNTLKEIFYLYLYIEHVFRTPISQGSPVADSFSVMLWHLAFNHIKYNYQNPQNYIFPPAFQTADIPGSKSHQLLVFTSKNISGWNLLHSFISKIISKFSYEIQEFLWEVYQNLTFFKIWQHLKLLKIRKYFKLLCLATSTFTKQLIIIIQNKIVMLLNKFFEKIQTITAK